MPIIGAFDNIDEDNVKKMLTCFNATTLHFKKDAMILSNLSNATQVGIILNGGANVVRYNFNGSRTIIETLSEGDIFGEFTSSLSEELYIISSDESDIILFEYEHLINRCKKNCEYHNQFVHNMLQILSNKIRSNNERTHVLTKKTIREKLLAYFDLLSKKQISKNIILPFTLTDMADYLSIDRTAMMREMRNLKDEGFIESKGKKIYLKY